MIDSKSLKHRRDRLAAAIERARVSARSHEGGASIGGLLAELARDLEAASAEAEPRVRAAGYDEIESRLVRAGAPVWPSGRE